MSDVFFEGGSETSEALHAVILGVYLLTPSRMCTRHLSVFLDAFYLRQLPSGAETAGRTHVGAVGCAPLGRSRGAGENSLGLVRRYVAGAER